MSVNLQDQQLQYRPEVDGLRALAIIPVVFFHAGFTPFSGGFVGVDIFFVISGFLITRITINRLENGSFTFRYFYERRARRILPPLFVTMIASLAVGYFTLMPDEFKNLGQSLVATTLISNNVLLAATSGYWDLASEFKPLLHTWSLGVEEQYYFALPPLLVLIYKRLPSFLNFCFLLLFSASFYVSIFLSYREPAWTFYSFPTRAWELSIGGW